MSIILAKFFGIYLLVIGTSFLYHPKNAKKIYRSMRENEGVLYLSGFLGLLMGSLIIAVHNFWVWQWPVMITILGWWALIKGFLIIHTSFAQTLSEQILSKGEIFFRLIGFFWLVLGLFFFYQGWG